MSEKTLAQIADEIEHWRKNVQHSLGPIDVHGPRIAAALRRVEKAEAERDAALARVERLERIRACTAALVSLEDIVEKDRSVEWAEVRLITIVNLKTALAALREEEKEKT